MMAKSNDCFGVTVFNLVVGRVERANFVLIGKVFEEFPALNG
jgi:hypothetical protein